VRSGIEPSAWAAPSSLVAEPGDIVVADVGKRGAAAVVYEPLIPGSGVSLIRLIDSAAAPRVVDYMNSQPGQAARSLLVTGEFVPHFTLRSLRSFRIPEGVLTGATVPASHVATESLSTRLDSLLWR
jgi:hypothetical protein